MASAEQVLPEKGMAATSDSIKAVDPKPDVQPVPYLKLYSHAEPFDYLLIALGTFGAVVNGVTMPLFTVVFGDLVDTYGEPDNSKLEDSINRIALNFVYLAIAALVASFLEVSMFTWTGVRQASKVRQVYLEAALCQDITFYDVQSTSGDVLTALNDDTHAYQNAIGEKVGNTIHHCVTFLAGIIIAFINGWKLTLVMLSLTPLLGAAGMFLSQVMTKGGDFISSAYSKAQTLCSQAITNIRTVVSFGTETRMVEAYKASLAEPCKVGVKLGVAQGLAAGMLNGVVFCTYGLAFWYGERLVRVEGYSGGDVMIVIFSAIIGGFGLGQAGPNFQYFATGRVAGRRLFSVIDRVPPINIHAPGIVPTTPTVGNIELKDVEFSYPARPDLIVFKSFSLSIAAGEEVALVGQSGSGKSTVIQLIERFYDPAAGAVYLDGVDIRQLSLPWYRSQVGLVSQEPTLFATTIKANILLGAENSSDAEVEAAAKAANAHRFIMLMPQGYNTQVGERGVQLSGGQKQRIAIARAILKNPRIMLLDEATSALDTRSERMVQAAIDRLAVGRTTVVVAHRLSTIRNANKIAVVQSGTVVEQGTHAALFANTESVYHNLVKLQEMAHTVNDEKTQIPTEGGDGEEVQEVEQVLASQRDLENDSKKKLSIRKMDESMKKPKDGDKIVLVRPHGYNVPTSDSSASLFSG